MTTTQQYILHCIEATRSGFIQLLNNASLEQINTIPKGFNNNLAWNFGHISVSALVLAYKATGVKPNIEIPYFELYKKGSSPIAPITQSDLESLKEYAIDSIQIIKEGILNKDLTNITPYTTATFGVPMTDIDEIIATIAMHDNLHFGVAMAQRKLV